MKISILGCGWLGLPLAEKLIRKGHTVKGSTTTRDKVQMLREQSVVPYLLKLSPELNSPEPLEAFWDAEVLVLNIPPDRGRNDVEEYHRRQIESVAAELNHASVRFVIFVSSTSVYPDRPGEVSESDARPGAAARPSGNALLAAEQLLQSHPGFKTTIVRFGGLYGGERHPVHYLAGRKNVPHPEAPINLIHRHDCLAILTQILEDNITDSTFNAVSDHHPARKPYYSRVAAAMGLEPPVFQQPDGSHNHKVVSNAKLKERLSYTFIYPDPSEPMPPVS